MNLNIENFNIRRSKPYLAGPNGLAPGEERYIAKAQGLVGFEIFAEDKISIKNLEGKQTCEIVVFDQTGKSSPNLIKFFYLGSLYILRVFATLLRRNN